MSTPAPMPHRPAFNFKPWRPTGRAWLWVAMAFAVGLLLFLWAISGGDGEDFYRADKGSPTSAPRAYAPLPAPLPAGDSGTASGMGEARERPQDGTDRPRLVEAPKPPPTPDPAQAAPSPGQTANTATTLPMPIAGETPAPAYPRRALRRGESGTVRVRVEVGTDGRARDVSVQQSSGSRDLDRAAVSAVRRWRFHPARRGGEAVTGTVIVPISFDPE